MSDKHFAIAKLLTIQVAGGEAAASPAASPDYSGYLKTIIFLLILLVLVLVLNTAVNMCMCIIVRHGRSKRKTAGIDSQNPDRDHQKSRKSNESDPEDRRASPPLPADRQAGRTEEIISKVEMPQTRTGNDVIDTKTEPLPAILSESSPKFSVKEQEAPLQEPVYRNERTDIRGVMVSKTIRYNPDGPVTLEYDDGSAAYMRLFSDSTVEPSRRCFNALNTPTFFQNKSFTSVFEFQNSRGLPVSMKQPLCLLRVKQPAIVNIENDVIKMTRKGILVVEEK